MQKRSRLVHRIIGALFWGLVFLLMASRLPAEPAGTDMTADIDRAAVVSTWSQR